jgi:hypothetical protein
VQAVFLGGGANGRVSRISLVQAALLRGSVPPAGAQRRVYTCLPGWPWPSGQTVICSEVEATMIAARTFIVRG